jgi:hypothetical protein
VIALAATSLALWVAGQAMQTLEPALRAAESAPRTRVLEVVRRASSDPLLAEDLHEALAAAHALEPALKAVDAAVVDAQCALPIDAAAGAARVLLLSEQLRVLATVDAAAGRPGVAATHLVRAADVARLLVRCDGASLASLELARKTLADARAHTSDLVSFKWLDKKGAARALGSLEPPTEAELLRCAGPLAADADIKAVRSALAGERKGARALAERAAREAPDRVEQGDKVGVPDIEVRCAVDARTGRFRVSRAVLAVLRARGAEAILSDSQLFPSLDGSGIYVVSAGPGARSCGLRDQDTLVAINGRGVASAQDILAAREIVAADGRARFTVRRGGAIVDLELEPDAPPPSDAGPPTP